MSGCDRAEALAVLLIACAVACEIASLILGHRWLAALGLPFLVVAIGLAGAVEHRPL